MSDENDLTGPYMAKTQADESANAVDFMSNWAATFDPKKAEEDAPKVEVADSPEKAPPKPKPGRRATDDPLGRLSPEKSLQKSSEGIGSAARGLAEIPRQIVGGVDDAARNALGVLNPLTDWLNENVADLRYDPVTAAKTGTGAVTRKISEFLTGFIPALKGLGAVGVTNKIAAPLLAGAMADFAVRNPHEGRLSDLWNELGLQKNVLTDYLASDPADSNMEARFKNALEGAGLGIATEGVMMAARGLRALKGVRGVKQSEEAVLRAKYGTVVDEDLAAVGIDTKAPLFSDNPIKRAAGKLAKGAAETATTDPRAMIRGGKGTMLPDDFQVYVNFNQIDAPEKVKFVIGKMAEKLKGSVDEARRGVITQDATKAMADDLGMSVTDLLSRRQGQAFNAEEALAARQLWAASGEQLLTAAKRAAGQNAGPLDQFAFRKAMATHAAIQNEVLGARAEAGRGLASWAIPAGGSMEKARAIQQVMDAMGGSSTSKEIASRLALLGEMGASPAAIARFAERGFAANTADAIKEVWVNGLLSSPKTHMVNVTSNTMVVAQQIYERQAAAGIRAFTGGDGVAAGEAAHMTYAAVKAIKEAFTLSAKALKTGQTGWSLNKMDLPRTNALSAEAFSMSKETSIGRFVDFLGTATNVPGRLLGAEDEFFKTIGYRMEVHAQAFRQASQEGLKGKELAARVADLAANPSEAIRINAADAALYTTFTNEVGNFGKWVMRGRENIPGLTFIVPFVRTPVNIARYSFERTPLAPLVGQWRADIAAGGARADLALARMSTGTAIMLAAMDYADSGHISGGGPKGHDKGTREALMRQGWKPYSVNPPGTDRWHSYNRLDPLGMTLGFASDISEAVRMGELSADEIDEWHEVAAMAIATVSQVAINKTYLQGASNFIEMMNEPSRYSQRYVSDMLSSFLPGVALMSAVKNVGDPIQRETGGPWEATQAKILGLSDKLPPRRNLWGEKITSETGLGKGYDFISPIASSQPVNSPIDRELVRLDSGPLRIAKRTSFDGVQANFRHFPQAYDDYTRLSGNDFKSLAHGGLGAKDYLNSVVEGKHPMSAAYKVMSDESRKAFIQNTITSYRQQSQRQIMSDPRHKNFADEIQQLKQINQQARMPVLGE